MLFPSRTEKNAVVTTIWISAGENQVLKNLICPKNVQGEQTRRTSIHFNGKFTLEILILSSDLRCVEEVVPEATSVLDLSREIKSRLPVG